MSSNDERTEDEDELEDDYDFGTKGEPSTRFSWPFTSDHLIVDARYEKVRQEGVIRSRAVLVAIGVDWEGRRQILGVELANRESSSSWKEFLLGLKSRGLRGVLFVVSDDHPGLKRAIAEVLGEAFWQRCYVHFLRNALDYLPRKANDDCLTELRWFYERRNVEEARRDLVSWLAKWQAKYPKLCEWVENNIEETFSFYRLPKEHHPPLTSHLSPLASRLSPLTSHLSLAPTRRHADPPTRSTWASPPEFFSATPAIVDPNQPALEFRFQSSKNRGARDLKGN